MKGRIERNTKHVVLILVATMLVLGIISACEDTQQEATNQSLNMAQAASVTTSPHPYPTGLPTPVNHKTFDAESEKHYNEIKTKAAPTAAIWNVTKTAIARTPEELRPTFTPHPPKPTRTPFLGMFPNCSPPPGYKYLTMSCWAGMLDGQGISVVAGRERGLGNPKQGVVLIYHTLNPMIASHYYPDEVYLTPFQLGQIRIIAVAGTRFTVETYNRYVTPTPGTTPTIAIFDLATRQWVLVNGTPIPTSVPTLTPAITAVP